MKILTFENGEPGRLTSILGENVQGELEELLGGPIVWERLGGNLQLVTREDAKAAELDATYILTAPGHDVVTVQGNAVVVSANPQGGAKDLTKRDIERARLWITPL